MRGSQTIRFSAILVTLAVSAACGDDDGGGPADAGGRTDSGARDGGVVDPDGGETDAGPKYDDAGGGELDAGVDGGDDVDGGGGDVDAGTGVIDGFSDVVSTWMELDLTTNGAVAQVTVASAPTGIVTLAVGEDVIISTVSQGDPGADAPFVHEDGVLEVDVPPTTSPIRVNVQYLFPDRPSDAFDGWMQESGVSFIWPYFCGNLFPCNPSPADGATYDMNMWGVPDGMTALSPDIEFDAPAYTPAIALGDFTTIELGTTMDGTAVFVAYLGEDDRPARSGTAYLVDNVEFFEETYGEYRFGDRVGSVQANWGPGDYGGMEHHPYWHVTTDQMSDHEVHAHEAAHGWFGNGVRIACWEDFVLSEGLASYLSARAIEDVGGSGGRDAIWGAFAAELEGAVEDGDTIALPDSTCNEIDIYSHPLWSGIPYMKGAFFMREVERAVGREDLDAALASFYAAHVGSTARMQDLIDHIETETGDDIDPLVTGWLRSLGIPDDGR